MTSFSFFRAPPRPGDAWFSVGLASSYPDLGDEGGSLSQTRICNAKAVPGCKVFYAPKDDANQRCEIELDDLHGTEIGRHLEKQVLVFRYKGKFHAVDHNCPHSSYPLSQGMPFDIEDFGVVLSAGINCPKHDWSFDLFTGQGDRGSYKLKVWEVELRDPTTSDSIANGNTDAAEIADKEVWVRRKQRIG